MVKCEAGPRPKKVAFTRFARSTRLYLLLCMATTLCIIVHGHEKGAELMSDHTDVIGQRIRVTRTATGLSQAALAARIGTSQGHVSQWEDGRKTPSAKYLVRLARALNVSADWLLGLPNRTPTFPP